jgi:hypothetical protein
MMTTGMVPMCGYEIHNIIIMHKKRAEEYSTALVIFTSSFLFEYQDRPCRQWKVHAWIDTA